MSPLVSKISRMLQPLADFYRLAGEVEPVVEPVEGSDIPEPYRGLLVHGQDMTSTLERFWGEALRLQLLQVHEEDGVLYRQVLLVTEQSKTPVEFGAIQIFVERFEAEARNEIREGKTPLGAILKKHHVAYRSQPTGFFQLGHDPVMAEVLAFDGDCLKYGRHNVLSDPNGATLADVVEILPPVDNREMKR